MSSKLINYLNGILQLLNRIPKYLETCLVPEEVIAYLNEVYLNKYFPERYIEAAAITWNARWNNFHMWIISLFSTKDKYPGSSNNSHNEDHVDKNSSIHFIAKINPEIYLNNWALFIIFTMITLVITAISLSMLAILIQSNIYKSSDTNEILFHLFLPTEVLKEYIHNYNYRIINLPDFLKTQLLLLCSVICFFNSILEFSLNLLDKRSFSYYWFLFGLSFYMILLDTQYSFGECVGNWMISYNFILQANEFIFDFIPSLILTFFNVLILKVIYNQILSNKLLKNSNLHRKEKIK